MTSMMDELVAGMSGSVHVSQDLKALQDYLSRTISTTRGYSPNNAYRPMAPSRAPSCTRKPSALPGVNNSGMTDFDFTQQQQSSYHYPSSPRASMSNDNLFGVSQDRSTSRPAVLRRTSSYGSYLPSGSTSSISGNGPNSPNVEYNSFDKDAFAPLVNANSYASTSTSGSTSNPWAAFQSGSSSTSGFGFGGSSSWTTAQSTTAVSSSGGGAFGINQNNMHSKSFGRPPTPPDEDDEMMMDEVDEQIGGGDEDEEEQTARMMLENERVRQQQQQNQWHGGTNAFSGLGSTQIEQAQWYRGRQKA